METPPEELRRLALASTRVNAWYSHGDEDGTVRGPFCRWFTCSEVAPEYKANVASIKADCEFAAAAMNNLVPLLDELERVKSLLHGSPAHALSIVLKMERERDSLREQVRVLREALLACHAQLFKFLPAPFACKAGYMDSAHFKALELAESALAACDKIGGGT